MGNLIVGTEVIKFRDAISQVNRNIQTPQEKLSDSILKVARPYKFEISMKRKSNLRR
jgi:hypothetical protein